MAQPKIWFVTGASRGFGRIWTEAALKRGDRVAATARESKALDELVAAYGDSILALPLDVTDRDAVFEAVKRAHRHFGRLDVILCNAGYGYMGAIEEAVTADAQANFETNVFGTLSSSRRRCRCCALSAAATSSPCRASAESLVSRQVGFTWRPNSRSRA